MPERLARLLGRSAHLARSGPVVRRSLKVGVVVGVLLNLINQGDALWGSAELESGKALLTFLVPYVVSTVVSVQTVLERERGARAPPEA